MEQTIKVKDGLNLEKIALVRKKHTRKNLAFLKIESKIFSCVLLNDNKFTKIGKCDLIKLSE